MEEEKIGEVFDLNEAINQINQGGTSIEQIGQYGEPTENTGLLTTEQIRQQRIAKGLPVSANENRVTPTMGGEFVRGALRTPMRLATNVLGAASGIRDIGKSIVTGERPEMTALQEGWSPLSSKYMGEIKPIGSTIDVGKAPWEKQNLQAIKESVGAGAEMASYIPIAKGLMSLPKFASAATPLAKRALATGIEGAVGGVLGGGGYAMSENLPFKDIATRATIGGVAGFGIGSILGAVGGKKYFKKSIAEGTKPKSLTKQTLPEFQKQAVEYAAEQGLDPVKTNIIVNMADPDKKLAQQMVDIAAQAAEQPNKIIARPMDVMGKELVKEINAVDALKSQLGRNVDKVAKSLQGQMVDATPVLKQTLDLLDNLNVKYDIGTTKTGEKVLTSLDFSESIYKNVPKAQEGLNRFLHNIPASPEMDAWQLHIFKKGIDEFINYEKTASGLSGTSQGMLKQIRYAADNVLDSTFDNYNAANQDFSFVVSKLNDIEDLFRSSGIKDTTKSTARGASLLRSTMGESSQMRPATIQMLGDLTEIGKKYNLGFKNNLYDLAFFSESLKDIYGNQAITGLGGTIQKSVTNAMKAANILKSPVRGTLSAAGDIITEMAGITPAHKKAVLRALLATVDDSGDILGSAAVKASKKSIPILERIKNTPNKEGGFIRPLADIGGEVAEEAPKRMNLRATKTYKNLNSYRAIEIVEGFGDGANATPAEELAAWQYISDKGIWKNLQGWYGRTVNNLIENGDISGKIPTKKSVPIVKNLKAK